MTLFRTEPPSAAPVTLAEAKAHLRVETGDEDALIASLLTAATDHVEVETGLALMSQGWRLCLDDWPRDGIVRLRRTPVRSVDTVTVYDADGVAADLDVSGAVLDGHGRPARLCLPPALRPGRTLNGIEIDFTAGFGETSADVPETLKRAILLHVAHLYEFRGAVAPEQQPAGIPAGYDRLIAPHCRRTL
ncbi:MAG: head-tail connector protein [Pararhizobium sp.]